MRLTIIPLIVVIACAVSITNDGEAALAGSTYEPPVTVATDCSVDVSAELNAWIASIPDGVEGAPTTALLAVDGCYRIDSRLNVENRSYIEFDGNGASLIRLDNSPGFDGMQWFVRSSDHIAFRNMTVEGSNTAAFPSPGTYTDYEAQHLWTCWGCTDLLIEDVTGRNAWGDFVATAPDHQTLGQPMPGEVTIQRSHFRNSGRMGVSVTAGEGFYIHNNVFEDVAWSVLDIEIESSEWSGRSIHMTGNIVGRVYHYLVASGGGFSLDVEDVLIANNVMREIPETGSSYQVSAIGSNWTVRDNLIKTRSFGLRAKNATDIDFSDNTILARNFGAIPLAIENSTSITVANNKFLSADGNGHWSGITADPVNNVCGNMLEINLDPNPYSPPDRVSVLQPEACN